MKKTIIWAKWIDPYGKNRNQLEYVPEKDVAEDNFDINLDKRYEFEDQEDVACDHNYAEAESKPVIVTPVGILPLLPYNDISNFFNFWLGETNFNLSQERLFTINNIPGVASLEPLGRYMFRVAIGNCFKFQDVRQDIEKALGVEYNNEEIREANPELDENTKEQVKDIIRIHLKNHKHWALYILPNGKVDMAHADNEKENEAFKEKLDTFVSAQKIAGGAIFKSGEKIFGVI